MSNDPMIAGDQTTRALVIEDQDLMRLALINELKTVLRDCAVQGAATWEMASRLLQQQDFDLVITDPGLPGIDPTSQMNRLEVVKEAVESCPNALHIIITGSDSKDEGEKCRQLGANAYVGKTGLDRDVLISVIQRISETGFSLWLSEIKDRPPEFYYSGLTPREQEILDFMRRRPKGAKRKEIYEQMGSQFDIDPFTVEKYYKQARAKLIKNGLFPKGA
jgi:DNA-binding NarL/FixJ family response regulator